MRKVITVNDYSVSPDDINDFVDIEPGGKMELVIASHYHFYRTGMQSATFNGPAGASEENVRWLPEGDNATGSTIVVGDTRMLDEVSFAVEIDATNTSRGDNFILYFRTWSKDVIDWRWPKRPVPGRPRDFQIHLHVGESLSQYVSDLEG